VSLVDGRKFDGCGLNDGELCVLDFGDESLVTFVRATAAMV
jgi:hypothetical protein